MTHIYRSKPTTVEAALVKDDNLARVAEWCGGKPITQAGRGVIVPTINGNTTAWVGHYIVKGVSDFYPCDPETFAARWERADSIADSDAS